MSDNSIKASIRSSGPGGYRRLGVSRTDIDEFEGRDNLEIVYGSESIIKNINTNLFKRYGEIDDAKFKEWSGDEKASLEIDISQLDENKIEIVNIQKEHDFPKENSEKFVTDYIKAVSDYGVEGYARKHEGYKFEFVDNFQKKFDLEADNLYEMLEISIIECNLVRGGQYYARGVLLLFAEKYPDRLRDALRDLYNEEKNLKERIDDFRVACDELMAQMNKETNKRNRSSIDVRFISVLLSAKYPDRYYAIKPEETKNCVKEIDPGFKLPQKLSDGEKYIIYHEYCEKIKNYIKDNKEINQFRTTLTSGFDFKDENFHWMTQDVVYTGAKLAQGYEFLPEDIQYFLKQARKGDLETKDYIKIHRDLRVKLSFGQDSPTKVAWMAFLGEDDQVDNGIYPVILFYKEQKKVIVAYGVSEKNKPTKEWGLQDDAKTIGDYFGQDENIQYKDSYIKSVYDIKTQKEAEKNSEAIAKDLNEVIDFYKGEENPAYKSQYWIIAAGEYARYWEKFYDKGIIAIGWDELGDLRNYSDQKEVKKALGEINPERGGSQTNNSQACFQFCHEMKPGDYVFVKGGRNNIIGYGRIKSDYQFDDTRDHYKHIRQVEYNVPIS